ncbi:sugar transferase [uncultured Porphyromonas sp.]|uniref:sugar transferase n=1 Tax=uncultured Porphyromonas sp. TaxID=159274 RepID=UPI00258D8B2E|nr:sugar transferase [uncultured Porphyromonas sp.]
MYRNLIKRVVDFLLAFCLITALLPLLIALTIWLHFANKGAGVFFSQERPGKDERIFKLYKFKSMTDERDAEGNLLPDAQRLTNVGRFIRKTSLDELPQLWNVLKGDMSFIGPRPLLVRYLPFYTKEERKRHDVRPGITGLAQVNGRNHLEWDKRLALDVQYVNDLSFTLDVSILFKTIINVLKHKDVVVELDPKINVPLDIARSHGNQKTY